jgi:hypothetical protein
MRRTDVWISWEEIVDFLEYAASLEASVAMRSKISLTKLFWMVIALLEIPVSGWTCLRGFCGNAFEDIIDEAVQDGYSLVGDTSIRVDLLEDLVDVIGEAESRVYDVATY